MKADYFSEHWTDESDNPAGGVSTGTGVTISWQNGPLGKEGTPERREPNGAFVETVIDMTIDRLRFYQNSKFECDANEAAINALRAAAHILDNRTKERMERGVEGTHER